MYLILFILCSVDNILSKMVVILSLNIYSVRTYCQQYLDLGSVCKQPSTLVVTLLLSPLPHLFFSQLYWRYPQTSQPGHWTLDDIMVSLYDQQSAPDKNLQTPPQWTGSPSPIDCIQEPKPREQFSKYSNNATCHSPTALYNLWPLWKTVHDH